MDNLETSVIDSTQKVFNIPIHECRIYFATFMSDINGTSLFLPSLALKTSWNGFASSGSNPIRCSLGTIMGLRTLVATRLTIILVLGSRSVIAGIQVFKSEEPIKGACLETQDSQDFQSLSFCLRFNTNSLASRLISISSWIRNIDDKKAQAELLFLEGRWPVPAMMGFGTQENFYAYK